jgi:hypothetical protein
MGYFGGNCIYFDPSIPYVGRSATDRPIKVFMGISLGENRD